MPDRLIALEISDAAGAGGRSFVYNLRIDAQPLVSNRALSLAQSDDVRNIEETYNALFAQLNEPQLALAQIQAIGSHLFELWLKPHWQNLEPLLQVDDRQILVIASGQPEVLNLPWELLRIPGREDIGTDAGWGVRRLPWSNRQLTSTSKLEAGPLRVLFVACSPRDLAELDHEREEELLLRAVSPNAHLETGDVGTFDELQDRINAFVPHIVHLSGHGTIGDQGAAFVFENERGNSDPRSAQRLGQVFAGSGVRCAFISGCEAGRAPPRKALGGICQGIVAHGVPLAIGWGASIVDEVATEIAEAFYKSVARGQPVDRALARARGAAKWAAGLRGDPSWSLPNLYAVAVEARVFDESAPFTARPPATREQQALPGMVGSHAVQFVGRRRALQRILPRLRDGQLQGVVLTGMGGAGKSTLATRLARKLEAGAEKLMPIALSCRPGTPLTPQDLLDACGDAFLNADQKKDHAFTIDELLPIEQRMRLLVDSLNKGRFVLVLDNFESNLNEDTRCILDSEIAKFYRRLLHNLVGTSRVIITSRYLPADVDPLPDRIAELSLEEFSETSFLKFMFRDADIKRRYKTGAFNRELLTHLRQLFGGAPSFVKQIREELKTIDSAQLLTEVRQRGRPSTELHDGPLRLLEQKHDKYCAAISVDRLYNRLTDPSKRMLSCAAVYPGPITLDGFAAVANVPPEEVQDKLNAWRHSAMIYAESQSVPALWTIYGSLRGWLVRSQRLPIDDRRAAHRATANYLVKIQEQQREAELQLTHLTCLLEARTHYLAGDAWAEARTITDRLCKFLIRRNEYAEIERLNAELLEHEEHPNSATWIARSFLERAEYDKARQWYERALKFASDSYPVEKAHAIQGLATINIHEGHFEIARERFAQALEIQRSGPDRVGHGITWHQLGSIDFNEGLYAEARAKFNMALSLLKGSPAQEEEQAIWHQLGSIELQESDPAQARTTLGKALTIARTVGDRKAEAAAIHQLGRVDAKAGQHGEALQKLRQALELRQSIGDRLGEALSYRRLGNLATQLGRADSALRLGIVCYVIHKIVGHGETDRDLREVQQQATSLGYTPERLEALLAAVEQDYLRDRAKALLKQAFALQ